MIDAGSVDAKSLKGRRELNGIFFFFVENVRKMYLIASVKLTASEARRISEPASGF